MHFTWPIRERRDVLGFEEEFWYLDMKRDMGELQQIKSEHKRLLGLWRAKYTKIEIRAHFHELDCKAPNGTKVIQCEMGDKK